jgi:hypothetical protein
VARLRPVTTGAIAADRAEILAGVREGDRIVVSPPVSLAEGIRVTARVEGQRGSAPRSGSEQ